MYQKDTKRILIEKKQILNGFKIIRPKTTAHSPFWEAFRDPRWYEIQKGPILIATVREFSAVDQKQRLDFTQKRQILIANICCSQAGATQPLIS